MSVKPLRSIQIEDLRSERQRLSQECARLVWLRRLVLARRDLEVARLTGGAGLWGSDGLPSAVRQLLTDDAARTGPELLNQLSQSARTLTIATESAQCDLDAATSELVRRYHQQPGLCLTTAPSPPLVTAHR